MWPRLACHVFHYKQQESIHCTIWSEPYGCPIVGRKKMQQLWSPHVTPAEGLCLHFSFLTYISDYFYPVMDNSQLFSCTLPGNLFTFSNGSLYLSSYWPCPENMTLGMCCLTRDVTLSTLQDSLTWILFRWKKAKQNTRQMVNFYKNKTKMKKTLYLLGWIK